MFGRFFSTKQRISYIDKIRKTVDVMIEEYENVYI